MMTAEQAKIDSRKKGKPFCKVCFDAGKDEAEYTSHYLKSAPGPEGKLVCPTLLNQACLTCGQNGHTSSYCRKPRTQQDNEDKRRSHRRAVPEFTDDQREHEHEAPSPQQLQAQKVPSYNPRNNSFGALYSDEPEPQTQSVQSKPLTMAERLKVKMQQPQPQPQQPQPQQPQQAQAPLKLPELPPKSQFWWQDEDD